MDGWKESLSAALLGDTHHCRGLGLGWAGSMDCDIIGVGIARAASSENFATDSRSEKWLFGPFLRRRPV